MPTGIPIRKFFFDEKSLRVIEKLDRISSNVSPFESSTTSLLFGNRGKAVHIDAIDQVSHSLVLIRPTSISYYEKTYPNGKHQVRTTFTYNGHEYDLPITDLDFLERYNRDPDFINGFTDYFFTISLGVEHEGFHSKLVAAVFCF